MWIPRNVEPRLRRSARTRPVVVLTGARQTGKTSTLRRLFPDARLRLARPAHRGRTGGEGAGAPSCAVIRHPRSSTRCSTRPASSVTSRPRRRRPWPARPVPADRVAEVHADEGRLRIAGRARRHRGTRDVVARRRFAAAVAESRLETAIVRGGFPELHANPGHRRGCLLQLLPGHLPRARRPVARQRGQPARLRAFPPRVRAAIGQPAQQGRPRARRRHRAVDGQPVAVGARGLRAGRAARAVVLEPHQVDRQEPEALPGRHRAAVRPAQHPVGG